MKKITVYTTPTCVYCKMTKDYFKSRGLEYQEFDVAADATKREEMTELTGNLAVPVIVIGDRVVLGFDRPAIEQALAE